MEKKEKEVLDPKKLLKAYKNSFEEKQRLIEEERLKEEKKRVHQDREALVEMYKAGFLDGYRTWKEPKTDDDWKLLNKFYKLDFAKRFAKRITKVLKKKK